MAFRCGCDPGVGVICGSHCQWQGCERDWHTAACVAGERAPTTTAIADEAHNPEADGELARRLAEAARLMRGGTEA